MGFICGMCGHKSEERCGHRVLQAEVDRLKLQVSDLQKKLANEERAHEQTMEDRDRFEEKLAEVALDAGCKEEWSNIHAHGDCITNEWDAKLKESNRLVDEFQKKLLKIAVHCDFPEELLGRPCGGKDEMCKCRCAQCMAAKELKEPLKRKHPCPKCGHEWETHGQLCRCTDPVCLEIDAEQRRASKGLGQ